MYKTSADESQRIFEFIQKKLGFNFIDTPKEMWKSISIYAVPNFDRVGVETYAVQYRTLVVLVTGSVKEDGFYPDQLAFVDWFGDSSLTEKKRGKPHAGFVK